VHSTIAFSSRYTLVFVVCAAVAISIRLFGFLIGQALLYLFIFIGLPFISIHSFGSKLAPKHPQAIMFLTLASIAACIA
jgi:hypothetical protein